jgi:hypothetical protein
MNILAAVVDGTNERLCLAAAMLHSNEDARSRTGEAAVSGARDW